jgi:hypothetical protein
LEAVMMAEAPMSVAVVPEEFGGDLYYDNLIDMEKKLKKEMEK